MGQLLRWQHLKGGALWAKIGEQNILPMQINSGRKAGSRGQVAGKRRRKLAKRVEKKNSPFGEDPAYPSLKSRQEKIGPGANRADDHY
jgi:hypothetical protein